MAGINRNYAKLAGGYLFPEITKRVAAYKQAYAAKHGKEPEIMRLGIGNTTEPLTPYIIKALHSGVDKLSRVETYTGYGDEQGDKRLREALVKWYSGRGVSLDASEVFVSDGAKSDAANIQSIFSPDNVIAVQDPAYPVYVDTNVIAGRINGYDTEKGQYDGIVYMPCTEKNGFFPNLPVQKVDLIYLCSPNNPTGAVATKKQLKAFVDYARKNKAVIVFDSAYSMFITDPALPRSIYEIEGAEECAIELSSFSKWAGFTGVRLGWTIVPKRLAAEDSKPGELNAAWNRRQTTFFNGASNIAQEGGLAVLSEAGQKESQGLVDYYMANAGIILKGLKEMGLTAYGGINAPYVWMKTPGGMKSWEFFDKLLDEARVVCTPGAGFGPSGEGFVRLSAFGHRKDIEKAVASMKENLRL